MKKRILLLLALSSLCACGQKGPLVPAESAVFAVPIYSQSSF